MKSPLPRARDEDRCSRCGRVVSGSPDLGAPRCRCSGPAPHAGPGERAAPVASPCIGVCELDRETGTCLGCSRTIDEITRWPGLADDERREILRRLGE